jgi:hypothetical protein
MICNMTTDNWNPAALGLHARCKVIKAFIRRSLVSFGASICSMSDRLDPSQDGAARRIVSPITLSFRLRSLIVVGIH